MVKRKFAKSGAKEQAQEKLPIEISAGGKNAHLFWCEMREQTRFYGVCVYLINRWKSGALVADTNDIYDDCCASMDADKCPALAMRAREEAAGHALFYKPMGGTPDHPQMPESEKPSWRAKLPLTVESVPEPKADAPTGEIANMDMAQIVTDLAAESPKKAEAPAPVAPARKETMLETARRLQQERRNKGGQL